MAKDNTFQEFVVSDLFGNLPNITSKAMFGGWAVYDDGVIFAVIFSGELYFKVDDSTRPEFERMHSHPLATPKRSARPVRSYWSVPESILEDRKRLLELRRKAVAASRKRRS